MIWMIPDNGIFWDFLHHMIVLVEIQALFHRERLSYSHQRDGDLKVMMAMCNGTTAHDTT